MNAGSPSAAVLDPKVSYIRDVWHDNLEQEMANIRQMIINYPVISMVRAAPCSVGGPMPAHRVYYPPTHPPSLTPGTPVRPPPRLQDTEFPGVVAKPIGSFKSASDFHYQTLRCNVDLLKIIQLGLTFSDDEGELAPGVCTYQFNFKFSLNDDIYAQDSIDLLTRSGINFQRHEDYGIDVVFFAELFISSGCVLSDDVKWISFHSGYDFGYLVKLLTCKRLPAEEDVFFLELKLYFPSFYDIKYLMKACEGLKGGLNKLAEDLEVERIGPEHQAGSDSLLTQATYYKMRQLFFEDEMDEDRHMNILYGLERGANLVKGGPGGSGNERVVNVSSSAQRAEAARASAEAASLLAQLPTGGAGSAGGGYDQESSA